MTRDRTGPALPSRRELLGLSTLLLIFGGNQGCNRHGPRPLRIAAASDVEPAFTEIGVRFTARTGRHVVFSFGSSGSLAQQIDHGAPLDLYAAASTEHVQRLRSKARLVPSTIRAYARGQLTLWARPGLPPPATVQELAEPRFSRIALANPEHAPYGQAAVAALKKSGIYEAVHPRLVFGENVRQAQQIAQSGNADVAMTALSLALREKAREVRHVIVPPELYPALTQTLGVVAGGDTAGAAQFADFLLGEEGQAVLRSFGFLPP